jgi:signal transduction histidine kinase
MKLGYTTLLFLILSLATMSCIETVPSGLSENAANTFQNPFMLSKDWELYWNRFLAPVDFARNDIPGERIHEPLAWHRRGKGSTGFATYRLVLQLPYDSRNCSLHFPAINSASRIWVNGVLMDSSGFTGQSGNYTSKIRSSTISLSQSSPELELVVQVANYTTLSAGIVKTPFIQNTTRLVRAANIRHGIQNCLIGILLAMCIYQAILFFFHRDDRSFVVLAVICLFVAIRSSLVTGESQLLSELFPSVRSDLWFKLGFFTVYSTLFLLPLYIYFLFQEFAPRRPLRIYFLISSGLCVMVLFTPHYVYGYLLDVYHVLMLTVFVYAIFSISKAFRNGNEEARLILWGFIISFPFIVVEMMQNSHVIKLPTGLPFLTEIGLLTFLQFQVVLLSNRYATSYMALKTMNKNLEVIVQERTNEFVNANRIKDRLLSILSHDIKSPLNALKGMIGLFYKQRVSQREFTEMIQMVESELSKTTLLVENILTWTAEQLKGVVIKKERFDLLQLLELNIQLFQSALEKKQISICHDLISNLQIVTDQSILNTVIRNLLANAIKFTPLSGKISIQVLSDHSQLLLAIQDNGVGMDDATLKSLINQKNVLSGVGTANERGTGLGIMLCHELLQKVHGELKIESQVNKGSKFLIAIPIQ